jgi:undecaprenyl-diphosphatase
MYRNLIRGFDDRILNICSLKMENKLFDRIMPKITSLNDYGQIYIALAIFSIIAGYDTVMAMNALMALTFGLIIGEGFIKHLVRRTRPQYLRVREGLLIKLPKSFSFPSGHTTSSFAVLGVLWYTNSNLKYIFLLIAILISFSRLYLYVHFPSDVLAGIILGLICGKIVIALSGNVYYMALVSRIISGICYLT